MSLQWLAFMLMTAFLKISFPFLDPPMKCFTDSPHSIMAPVGGMKSLNEGVKYQ